MRVVIGGLVTDPVEVGARPLCGPSAVPVGGTVSFDGWFAALPLAYWARFTDLEAVHLDLTAEGEVEVEVLASDASGAVRRLAAGTTDGGRYCATVPVAACDRGGWVWPRVTALPTSARPASGTDVAVGFTWTADVDVVPRSLTVAIATFNRGPACVRQLGTLAAAMKPGGVLADVVGRVVVVDQGTEPLAGAEGFDAVADHLGSRLAVVRQANLGGSGGFARGMVEAFADPQARHVALLDDDAFAQPEGLARAWAFAHATRTPTIVGGHMFDSARPTVLYRLGEVLDRRRFTWASLPGTPMNTDLADQPVTAYPWLGPARSVDFQPWWMALVPREVVERVGLPLPFFLKWDDVELGLRAGGAGVPSVVLPGAAVWHDSWAAKGNETSWPAYFLLRNRVVTALLHDHRSAALAAEWLAVSLRHVARREPQAAAMRFAALKDVLAGPAWLHRDLRTARRRAEDAARREGVAPHPVSAVASTLTATARLVAGWARLRSEYRSAAREAVSASAWAATFEEAAAGEVEAVRPVWSLVVVSYHSLAMLERYWSGLLRPDSLGPWRPGEVEVLLVDNADQPEVAAFAAREGFVYRSMGANVGLSAANNRGAEMSRGTYLLFANPDLGVRLADLPALARTIDATGGIVTPRLDFPDGRPQSAARAEPYLPAKLAHRGIGPRSALDHYLWPVGPYESGPVTWVAGGATAMSAQTFREVGGWPEEYFLYMEDVELGIRAGAHGIPVSVTADVRWTHEWRGDSRRRLNRGHLLHARSALRFYSRHPRYLGWPR
ncbi:glycosyltransferase [Pedococcus sp. NPDC057267]|uniref:glycosyltransferase n=1 Tax=Pedococcus sp. NPDC057267 TaxID=3346077 RepID=UPI00363961BD